MTDAARDHSLHAVGPSVQQRRRSGPGATWIVFLSALVLVPALATGLWEQDPGLRWDTGAHLAWVSRDVVLLLATAISYVNWRVTASATLGWYTAALSAVALHFLAFDLLSLTAEHKPGQLTPDETPDVVVLLAVPVLILLAVRCAPVPDRLNPLALGVMVSLASGGLRLFQLHQADDVRSVQAAHPWLLVGAAAVIGAASCVLLANSRTMPPWARRSSALSGSLLLASVLGQGLFTRDEPEAALAALGTVGAIMVTMSTLQMCVETALTVQASTALLNDRVVQAEQLMLHDREVLHELRSTVAGVTKANTLLRRADTVLPRTHRTQLQGMVEQELSRMERLPADRPIRDRQLVDLDDLIDPLVVAQRALGYVVRWEPSGLKALGAPDDIVEALHILLTNSARHAPGAPVEVAVSETPAGGVAIRVSDSGPGIDEEVAGHLVERGAPASTSPGGGLGLQVARRRARDSGGDLRVDQDPNEPGTAFVLFLPGLEQETVS